MPEYTPIVRRRLTRLRWVTGMLVIFWVISAVGLYRIYPYIPKISPWNDLVTIAAALLGFGAFLFIYLVYRIGLVVEEDDPSDDQADASDAAESG